MYQFLHILGNKKVDDLRFIPLKFLFGLAFVHLVSLPEQAFLSVFCSWLNRMDVPVRDVLGSLC